MAKQAFAVMLQEDEYRTYVGAQGHPWQQYPFGALLCESGKDPHGMAG